MRIVLISLGMVSIVLGLFWMGQGLGWITWPAQSFMVSNRRWVWIGAALIVLGLELLARRRRRRRTLRL